MYIYNDNNIPLAIYIDLLYLRFSHCFQIVEHILEQNNHRPFQEWGIGMRKDSNIHAKEKPHIYVYVYVYIYGPLFLDI